VIDCGSGFVRAGFTGDAEPCIKIPAVYQGQRPVVRGDAQDWAAWTGLLSQTFAALGVNPAGKLVLLTESPEMNVLAPASSKVVVTPAPSEAAWKGGAKLAGAEGFQPMWVIREEYVTVGTSIINTKCI
jgi:actin-related protein